MTRLTKRKPSALLGSCKPKKTTGVPKGFNRVGNTGCVKPEDTPAGREHVRKWRRWLANPNREAFVEFILSAYC